MDCEKYPIGSRRRAICDGTADLPADVLRRQQEALRKPAVQAVRVADAAALPFDPQTMNDALMTNRRKDITPKQRVEIPAYGAGSELVKIYVEAGVPSCKACKHLADKMNLMGTEWCRENVEPLVEDIFPRAKAWVADNMPWRHTLLPGIVEDIGIRRHIRKDLLTAIDRAEKNPNPPPSKKNSPSVSAVGERGERDAGRVAVRLGNGCPPLPEPPPISVTPQDVIDRCEVVVKSFRRHKALDTFLRSLWARYPGLPVLIADDSFEPGQKPPEIVETIKAYPNVRWFQMPFDSGLSAGRNLCVQESTRDIIILADDDYIVTKETRLERFVAALDARPDLSLIGGCIRNGPKHPVTQWAGTMTLSPGSIFVRDLGTSWRTDGNVRTRDTDLCWNFFGARRSSLLAVPWDNLLKIAGEHVDFFMARRQARERSAFTDEVIIIHKKEHPAGYTTYRNRTAKFYDIMKRKWKLKRVGSPHPMTICGERP